MFVATLVFAGLSFTKPRPHRVFHYITAAITMVAAIAYFTMGADLGETGIKPEFIRSNPKVAGQLREIFYVRYIDWYASWTKMRLFGLELTLLQGYHYPSSAFGSASDRGTPVANHLVHSLDRRDNDHHRSDWRLGHIQLQGMPFLNPIMIHDHVC